MACLTSLPAEIRQDILVRLFPDSISISHPWRSLVILLHINRILRHDTALLINIWTPVSFVSRPSQLQAPNNDFRQDIPVYLIPDSLLSISFPWRSLITPFLANHNLQLSTSVLKTCGVPTSAVSRLSQLQASNCNFRPNFLIDGNPYTAKSRQLTLSIFEDSKARPITWANQLVLWAPRGWVPHAELVQAWIDAVPNLPSNPEEIHLDVTPVPADSRRKHPLQLRSYVHERSAREHFLDSHIDGVSRLVRDINKRFGGRVPIHLTGSLSEKSEFFVNNVRSKSGVDIKFKGTWVTAIDALWPSIAYAASTLAHLGQVKKGKGKGKGANRLTRFMRIKWSWPTKWAFAKVVHDWGNDRAMEILTAFAKFEMDEKSESMSFEPVRKDERALQHHVAYDLGLESESYGSGSDRYVVVSKRITFENVDTCLPLYRNEIKRMKDQAQSAEFWALTGQPSPFV
ncbi:hypothetical protein BU24DRAFT_427316 [Aaosphaeria arxii CBS 175.79]|uniref:R3H domain-containing protein n=1 Tax=Aaosphaeria arxii CBS 175.79 TaxID=1450172 RepID=A0A6A5XDY3_9PLEO|nr:uncharacterized protein BU24DRAFT_427316 [Aaosphaeria arxii CBS 175.79]KAF2011109.1 hypothetical protein BU24DRAFT_427316 [Aaosphaeria arxii CBS 175.79]